MRLANLGMAAGIAMTPGCSVERDNGVDLSDQQEDCPCEQPFELLVNTATGGEVKCDEETQSFPESATVTGLCADNKGFVFKVLLNGPGYLLALDPDGNEVAVDFDLGGGSEEPVSSWEFEVKEEKGGTVKVTVP